MEGEKVMNKQNLKRGTAFIVALILLCAAFGAFVKFTVDDNRKITEFAVTASADNNAPVVYMTEDISPEGLVKIYEKMNFDDTGKTAVKISTGESNNSNHLRPELIGQLVQSVNGKLVECNTAYGGSRSTTALHKQQLEQRGYDAIGGVDLMDEDGDTTIPITIPNSHLKEDYVGKHIVNYDNLIVLSHFKGHQIAGYGGAIKNTSIGMATFTGKNRIHTTGNSNTNWTAGGTQDGFLECMGEATSAVRDYFDGRVVYINVMNNLSIDCDCNGRPSTPTIHDMGILASYDPVALDKACLDLIYNHVAEENENTQTFINRVQNRNGLHTLEYAEQIGLGSREYQIMSIDDEESEITMTYSEGAVTISRLTEEAKLLHASYINGYLDEIDMIDAENGENLVNAKTGDKIFLWNSLGGMYPLHKVIEIE